MSIITASTDVRVAASAASLEEDAVPLPPAEDSLESILAGAAAGRSAAWQELSHRFSGLIMSIARSCRLSEADVADVYQTTWLRLVENVDRIRNPERLGAWLATTAKRESLRISRAKTRCALDDAFLQQLPDENAAPLDAGPIAEEQALVVREAFAKLPPRCQRLLGLMSRADPPSYREISQILSMPVGSIGPTRGRCLEHLRRIVDELNDGRAAVSEVDEAARMVS
jgi:RNA polymerase sigma factor (sigma-70 family)